MKTPFLLCALALALAPLASRAGPAPASSTAPASSVAPASSTAPAHADTCASLPALPAAAGTFTVGTLRVQRYGDHGRPVILIPGLGSGSWVWAGTVRHLRARHVVYALTLAGFDGVPAPARMTGLMDQADAALLKLITSHHIDHPVLVGHSLGGTLALRFVGEHGDLLGGVVAVDGLPVFPGADALSPAQRTSRAGMLKSRMAGMSQAQFAAQQSRYMQFIGVRDATAAACYGKLSARSNPAATAEYAAEDYAADYRAGLRNVSVPVLEISPYNAPDFKQAAQMSGQPLMSAAAKAAYYRKLLGNDAGAKVVTIDDSRHFVMLDQPRQFLRVVDRFLADLPAATQ